MNNKLYLIVLLIGILSLFSSVYAQDRLTLNYGDGSTFTNVDNLTPSNNASWNVYSGTRQIQIVADFSNPGVGVSEDRKVTVQIPRGFQIKSYSAAPGTEAISGVDQLILSDADKTKLASSTLTALDGNSSWAEQQITGYTGYKTSAETPYHNMDGMVTYLFHNNCDNITLTLTLAIDPLLIPYNATSAKLPDITVSMTNNTSLTTFNERLTITATGLAVPTLYPPAQVFNNGYSRMVAGVVNSSDATENTGTAPAFMTGISYLHQSNSTISHYADEIVFTTTYPFGVQYQGFDIGIMPDTYTWPGWWMESHTTDNTGGTYANGHLIVAVNTATRTVTYTLNDILADDCAGTSLIRNYWTATVDNNVVKWNQALSFPTTMTEKNGSLIGDVQTVPVSSNTVDITVSKPAINLVLIPGNLTIRDLNAYAKAATGVNFPYDYALGSIQYNNNGPSQPENITYKFTFPASPQVRGVSIPGGQPSDASITASGITNTGRTVTYSGTLAINFFVSMEITPELLGLAADEYLTSLTVKQNTLAIMNGVGAYTFSSINYFGKWINGQEGNVDLTITDATNKVLASATDHTRIGWTTSGSGQLYTTVQTPTGNPTNTFYPGQTIYFTSSYMGGETMFSNNNVDNVDPEIYINLPKGINLDVDSVIVYSSAGNNGAEGFSLQLAGSASVTIGGVQWMSYHFRVKNPLDIVVLSKNQSDNDGSAFSLQYSAVVTPACAAYPTLLTSQICQFDLGMTAVNSKVGYDYTIADTPNLTGKGATYMVVGATNSPNLSVVQQPGLQVYLGIRPVTDAGPFYVYTGQASTIAPVAINVPAEIQITYQNTSDNPYYAGSEIYLPVPKTGVDYDHFFYNSNFDNPTDAEASGTANQYPQWSGFLMSQIALPGFDAYYGIDVSNVTNFNAVTGTPVGWKPVGMTFYSYSDLIAAGYSLIDVTMLKFTANENIPGGVVATGEGIFDMNVDPSGKIGQINYWRCFEKGWTDSSGSGAWTYGAVLAAMPKMTVKGLIFHDANVNGALDAGESYTAATPVPAYFTATLTGPGITGSLPVTINPDGSFDALNQDGTVLYIETTGDYTLTIINGNPVASHFTTTYPATRSYFTTTNPVYPVWMNDIPRNSISADNSSATFTFTVTDANGVVQLTGVGIKDTPKYISINPNIRGGIKN